MNMVWKALLSLVVALGATPSLAWNMAGHMLTGSFVYQELCKSGDKGAIQGP